MMQEFEKNEELKRIKEFYEERKTTKIDGLYDPLSVANCIRSYERKRAIIELIKDAGLFPPSNKKVLEIGCGSGGNILELINLGFNPENCIGNEFLEDRVKLARHLLPEAVKIILGDALDLDFPAESFDIIYQSTVFHL